MRSKLFLLSVVLVAVGLLAAEVILVPRLERTQIASTRTELGRLARAAGDAWLRRAPDEDAHDVATRLGRLMGVRVTFIDGTGRVVGDSQLARESLARVEDHGDRPEIAAAFDGQIGTATRRSATIGTRLMYVAAPPPVGYGVVSRVALPLTRIDDEVAAMRRAFRVAAGVGLLIAALLSWLASHLAAGPLRELTEVARGLARRDFSRRAHVRGRDEIASLGRALNALSADLEQTLGDLTRERDLLDAVLSGMTEGVMVCDESERVLRANPASERLFGVEGRTKGRTILEISRNPELREHVARVFEESRGRSAEIEFPGPPSRYFMVASAPLAWPHGVVSVFHDVTRLRRLESMRRDFVANVSHELRTPVATLQAAGETLLDGAIDDPERARDFTAIVVRNAERLGRLVSDLLDLARLDAGEYETGLRPIELAAAVRRAQELLGERAGAKRIELRSEVDDGLKVRADPSALEQVLVNLLDNAVKYTAEEGEIGVTARREGEAVEVSVWDTGPGIEPQHRARVFERFYRVDPGRSRELGGTGLGLSIVKHLVDALGGEVGVDERSGGGARFWFTLLASEEEVIAADDEPT